MLGVFDNTAHNAEKRRAGEGRRRQRPQHYEHDDKTSNPHIRLAECGSMVVDLSHLTAIRPA
jgi:hypothetical protein